MSSPVDPDSLLETHLDGHVPTAAASAEGPLPMFAAPPPPPFPCFWTFLSFRSLRFLHIPNPLKQQMAECGISATNLLGQSLFDYLHPADAQLIQRDFRAFMDLQTLQGSIIRCRVKHLFADPMQSVPANPFTVCDHVTYRRVDGLRDEDFVLADIGMNPINEDCVLAFFHIGRDHGGLSCAEPFKGETYRWAENDIAGLTLGLHEALKKVDALDRKQDTSRAVDIRRDAAASQTRFIKILDAEDLGLLFVYPENRFSSMLGTGAGSLVKVPDLPGRTIHPDDYRRFREELTNKTTVDDNNKSDGGGIKKEMGEDISPSKLHTCTSKLFYLPHRTRMLARPQGVAGDLYMDAESVVIPYGTVLFVCTQTVAPPILFRNPPAFGVASTQSLLDSPSKTAAAWAGESTEPGSSTKKRNSLVAFEPSKERPAHLRLAYPPGYRGASSGDNPLRSPEPGKRRGLPGPPYDYYMMSRQIRPGAPPTWPLPNDPYFAAYADYYGFGLPSADRDPRHRRSASPRASHEPESSGGKPNGEKASMEIDTGEGPSSSQSDSYLEKQRRGWEKHYGPPYGYLSRGYYAPFEYSRMRAHAWDHPGAAAKQPELEGRSSNAEALSTLSPGSAPDHRDRRRYSDDLAGRPYASPIKKEARDRMCESCLTKDSPEWRKGPTGQKTLCNACGLRYSRSVNKTRAGSASSRSGSVGPHMMMGAPSGMIPSPFPTETRGYREALERAAAAGLYPPMTDGRPIPDDWTGGGTFTRP